MNLLTRLKSQTVDHCDNNWERPGPTRDDSRRDVIGVIIFALVSAFALELTRGFGMVVEDTHAAWVQHGVLALMIVPLVFRRKYPVLVMLVMSALFIGLSLLSPLVSLQLSYQVAYFASLYSAIAWAKDRRVLWVGIAVVVAAMTLWLILALTVANTFDGLLA
ncbi:hypothetical protein [Arthrobacter sp. HLT1-21]